ncbi:MAG: 30S ribosomal protein S8 [Candidatus Hydrogenedentota bacterium]|nr:MAG: 30S ribosomal protein S8 [Candidatus Hydrogenedentota bacterium]
MSRHDIIGDFLTVLRNASRARKDFVEFKGSNLILRMAELLRDEGYIADVKVVARRPQIVLRISLKYDEAGEPVFSTLRRVSRPSRRVYIDADRIRKVLGGLGISIISTSQGLMTDRQARRARRGGEILCEVW